jgi:hypothetical protein
MTALGGLCAGAAVAVTAAVPALAVGSSWQFNRNPAHTAALQSVYVASPTQAWAVGSRGFGPGQSPVIESWSSTGWHKIRRFPAPAGFQFDGVGGSGPSDVWAVGGGLIDHFNGKKWTQVSNPDPTGGPAQVSADSPDDAWGIGTDLFGCCSNEALVEHWDGTAWRITKTPFTSPSVQALSNILLSVDAISPTDVWILTTNQVTTTLWNYDGTKWHKATQPKIGQQGKLAALAGTAADDVWAVGQTSKQTGLIEHFNGTTWTKVPDLDGQGLPLAAVTALSPTDAWAMTADAAVSEHWNGTRWSAVPAINTSKGTFALGGQDGFPGGPPMSGMAGGPLFAVADNTTTARSVILQQTNP